ncbi:MAG: CHASE domain-containing protein, partial [Verrucomicrobiota bacterium]
VGAWLRHVLEGNLALATPKRVLKFFLLAGPLGCLISSVVGVSVLVTFEAKDPELFFYSWANWWLGDGLGVVIFTPLIMIFLGEPRDVWAARRAIMTPPLIMLCVTLIYTFLETSRLEHARVEAKFQLQAEYVERAIEQSLARRLEGLQAIENFYLSSEEVTPEEFMTYTEQPLKRHPSIHTLTWIPRVREAEREAFLADARSNLGSSFQLHRIGEAGQMVSMTNATEYYPIHYVEPREEHEDELGFDVSTDPAQHKALTKSRDEGLLIMTPPTQIKEDGQIQAGLRFFYPIYRSEHPPTNAASRQESLVGFAVGEFKVNDLVQVSTNDLKTDDLHFYLYDITGGRARQLFSSDGRMLTR